MRNTFYSVEINGQSGRTFASLTVARRYIRRLAKSAPMSDSFTITSGLQRLFVASITGRIPLPVDVSSETAYGSTVRFSRAIRCF